MVTTRRLSILIALLVLPLVLSAQGFDTTKIDQALGRSGQKLGEVYKVGFLRTDLHVTVHGTPIKPGLALGSWAAFSGSDENATIMGDLVLLQSEVNPVMEKLRAAGFEITALHNHLLEESPRVMYMHYMGRGPAAKLAESFRAALALSATPLGKPAPAPPPSAAPPAWVKTVEDAIARKGAFSADVLAFGVPRAEAISMPGMTVTPAQGVAESINFQEAGPGQVATTGDFVLTAAEVNPVISTLEAHHISITALHSHMLSEEPRLFFMHFWGHGSPEALALGIKAALSDLRSGAAAGPAQSHPSSAEPNDIVIAVKAAASKDCGCGHCAAKGCDPCHGKNCHYCVAKALVVKDCGCAGCDAKGCSMCGPGCDVCKFHLAPNAATAPERTPPTKQP